MAVRPEATPASLDELRAALAAETLVESAPFSPQEWTFDAGVLRHARTPFFEVAGFVDREGSERVLMLQPEVAIAGLLTARVDGERFVLLNARCEPGLHGLCQFSSTIQSTPSNYLRRHGGAATPLIELFTNPGSEARVLHDTLQYDWGQYYRGKRKRFALIEIDELIDVASPLVWVAETTLRELMLRDFSVTSDLRSAAALLWASDAASGETGGLSGDAAPAGEQLRQVPLHELRNWVIDDSGIRERVPSQGVSIEYLRMTSPSREVPSWTQPLMRVSAPDEVVLCTRDSARGREVAVTLGHQIGLESGPLLFPALPPDEVITRSRVATSAEGGRFRQHQVTLSLASVPAGAALEGATWLTEAQLAAQLLTPEATAVELRLVATLLESP